MFIFVADKFSFNYDTFFVFSLTAMKMEMVVQSPRAGTIKTLNIDPGMKIEGEDLILTFE